MVDLASGSSEVKNPEAPGEVNGFIQRQFLEDCLIVVCRIAWLEKLRNLLGTDFTYESKCIYWTATVNLGCMLQSSEYF